MTQRKGLRYRRGSAMLPYFFALSLFVFFLCLAVHLLIGTPLAGEAGVARERVVIGNGRIFKEDIAFARKEAISQASLKAVEEYLIQRLGYQGVANNFQRLDDEILLRAKEHIQDYQVISEFRTDKYVRVLMKVRVNEALLDKGIERMGLSEIHEIQVSVLFLVSERKDGFPPMYWWGDPFLQTSLPQAELSLSRVFEDRGFRVISRSFFPPEESYDEGMLSLTLDDEQAAKWGKLLSAQVVITGEANLYEASRASVFLRAINVKDGTILAQGYREGTLDSSQGGDSSSVELAISIWANDMLSFIIDAFRPVEKPIRQIIVTVRGLKSYKELRDFEEFLRKDLPQVRSVLKRTLNKDLVRLSVEVKGDSAELAEGLQDHPKRPLSFEINEVADQGFTVVVR